MSSHPVNPQKCGMVSSGGAWAEGGGELNFITIFVTREEAAVRLQVVLFPEADGGP